MRLKMLDLKTLTTLNNSSIRAGRSQNLPSLQLPSSAYGRYPVISHSEHLRAGQPEIRVCVVLDAAGHAAWLNVSSEEFAAIPEVEVSELEWSAAMCAGTPPPMP